MASSQCPSPKRRLPSPNRAALETLPLCSLPTLRNLGDSVQSCRLSTKYLLQLQFGHCFLWEAFHYSLRPAGSLAHLTRFPEVVASCRVHAQLQGTQGHAYTPTLHTPGQQQWAHSMSNHGVHRLWEVASPPCLPTWGRQGALAQTQENSGSCSGDGSVYTGLSCWLAHPSARLTRRWHVLAEEVQEEGNKRVSKRLVASGSQVSSVGYLSDAGMEARIM